MSDLGELAALAVPQVITFLRTMLANNIPAKAILAEYDRAQAEGREMTAADIAPYKEGARAAIDRLGDPP